MKLRPKNYKNRSDKMLLDCYLVQKWCEAVRICKRLDGPRLGRGENKGLKRCHRVERNGIWAFKAFLTGVQNRPVLFFLKMAAIPKIWGNVDLSSFKVFESLVRTPGTWDHNPIEETTWSSWEKERSCQVRSLWSEKPYLWAKLVRRIWNFIFCILCWDWFLPPKEVDG